MKYKVIGFSKKDDDKWTYIIHSGDSFWDFFKCVFKTRDVKITKLVLWGISLEL